MGKHVETNMFVGYKGDIFNSYMFMFIFYLIGNGGGMGRLRLTCGAVAGMAILAGMECGSTDANDREGKSANYKVVQELVSRFQKIYGTIICSELLQLKKDTPLTYEASERTAEYYKSRPCLNQVITCAKIFGEYYNEIRN